MHSRRARRQGLRSTLLVSLVVMLLALAACSEDGDVTLPTSEDGSAPEATAPETTQAPSGGGDSGDSGSSSDSDDNTAAIWAIVIIGLLVVGLVVWLASRSGAKRGAEEQRNAELAEQQRAEEAQRAALEQQRAEEAQRAAMEQEQQPPPADAPDGDGGDPPTQD